MKTETFNLESALYQLKSLEPNVYLDSDIEQYFRDNHNVIIELIQYLQDPLPQQTPEAIKVFYNGKLQTHLIYRRELNVYYVEYIPYEPKIPHEDIISQMYLFDGQLASFGIQEKTVIKRYSENLQQQIFSLLPTET